MPAPSAYVRSIEQRLAQLEAIVATLPQGEQAVPNYVVTDANGVATGLFPGGIEIDFPVSVYTPGAGVGWRNGVGGPLLASVFAQPFLTSVGHLTLNAYGPGGGSQRAQVAMSAQNTPSNGASFTVGSADGFGDLALITMAAGLENRTLLRDNGTSDFLQWNTGTPGLYGPYFCQALGLGAGAQQAFNVTLPSIPKGSSSDLFMFGACDPEGWGIARYHTPTPAGGPFTNIVIDLFNPTSVAQNIGWLFGLVNF